MDDHTALEQAAGHAQTIRHMGQPDDMASMVLFLATDESQWVSDQAMTWMAA
jgi:NAD(P)-dependent dehydrogenase (short-subunit alcohol dehydrogenase family)